MAETLAESMAKLELVSAADSLAGANDDEWIDSILDLAPPRTKQAQDTEEIKRELEAKYLTPSTTFSEPWLNRLQQYVIPVSSRLLAIPIPPTLAKPTLRSSPADRTSANKHYKR